MYTKLHRYIFDLSESFLGVFQRKIWNMNPYIYGMCAKIMHKNIFAWNHYDTKVYLNYASSSSFFSRLSFIIILMKIPIFVPLSHQSGLPTNHPIDLYAIFLFAMFMFFNALLALCSSSIEPPLLCSVGIFYQSLG